MVNCSGQTVTKCTCITDIAADLELSYAAEQCLIAHGGRSDETQKKFFLEWEHGVMVRVHLLNRR